MKAPRPVKIVPLDRQMCVLRFSPDGKLLAAGGQDASIRRLDATTTDLKPLAPLTGHHGWVTTLAFAADGKLLVSGDSWGGLRCCPVADDNPKPVWSHAQAHDGWIYALALSMDGKMVATAGADGKLCLWTAADGKRQRVVDHGVPLYSVAFAHDGKSVFAGDVRGSVRLYQTDSGKSLRDFDAKSMAGSSRLSDVGGARFLAVDSKGTTLAVAGALASEGKGLAGPAVLLFDCATGKLRQSIKLGAPLEGYVQDVIFLPDGVILGVLSGQPGQGKLFALEPGGMKPSFMLPLPNPVSLALQPGGKRLVVTTTNTGSNGNGRLLNKEKKYPGNHSPLRVFELVR
jgi:WD40 repeat protein